MLMWGTGGELENKYECATPATVSWCSVEHQQSINRIHRGGADQSEPSPVAALHQSQPSVA